MFIKCRIVGPIPRHFCLICPDWHPGICIFFKLPSMMWSFPGEHFEKNYLISSLYAKFVLFIPELCSIVQSYRDFALCRLGKKYEKTEKIPLGLENFVLPADKNIKVSIYVARSNGTMLFQKVIAKLFLSTVACY